MISQAAKKVLRKFVLCDNCLGRCFSQLLTGLTNAERGRIIRSFLALEYEAREFRIRPENFYGFRFRHGKRFRKKKCELCGGLFERLPKIARRIKKRMQTYEFETFMVSSRFPEELLEAEERVVKEIGIKWYESLKAEFNRELGKLIEKETGKGADERNPDLIIFWDSGKVKLEPQPLYIFGYYKKLSRNLPQTRKEGYPESVESIIAKPFLKRTGEGERFHGMGREDIDVRCLDWRPWVLEILKPKKRTLDLKQIQREINGSRKVRVKGLRKAGKAEVRQVKQLQPDKSYRVLVETEGEINEKILQRLKRLKNIQQRTPLRVAKRRADLVRRRKVKELRWKLISKRRFELVLRAEAGLYIKELVTGDEGRTNPSVSGLLGMKAKPLKLDVIKIWL